MEKVKELLFAVMTVSLSAGLVTVLSPEGQGGRIKKQIGFAVSVAVFALLASRVMWLFGGEFKIELNENAVTVPSDTEASAEIIARAEGLICDELEYAVSERYGITCPELVLSLDTENLSAIKIISAELSGEGELYKAAAYISELLCCDVTVKTEVNGE